MGLGLGIVVSGNDGVDKKMETIVLLLGLTLPRFLNGLLCREKVFFVFLQ